MSAFKNTTWLIDANEPFRGHVQSVLTPEGTVAYTDGLTVEQYEAERGVKLKKITDAELDALLSEYEAGLVTDPTEETEAQFWYALGVLPPCRWRTVDGVELFHISERLTGDLVSWHAQYDGRFFTFTDQARRAGYDLALKVRTAARKATQ
jgi:hypothetical protein